MTDGEMVGWRHQLYGHELEQAPGVGDEQGSLACCCPWDHKESHMTQPLNTAHISQKTGPSADFGSPLHSLANCVLPVVRIPDRERRLLETMQLAIGEFITDSSQGLPPSPRV